MTLSDKDWQRLIDKIRRREVIPLIGPGVVTTPVDGVERLFLLTGPTGAGKTWLACALDQHACRQGFPALYLRVPRLSPTAAKAISTNQGLRSFHRSLTHCNSPPQPTPTKPRP